MNLDRAKEKINKMKGIHLKFVYKGARNQIEEFEGTITKCFPSIFIIETDDHIIKSFNYNDYIIRNLKILS